MVTSTASSISRSSSSSSLADEFVKSSASGCSSGGSAGVVKLLCSYGGKILPRYPDGKLRYVGGETRVVSVDRSIHFTDILAKMGELCGRERQLITLRCQFPTEDLDALITIKSDEDLFNVIEEYDLANRYRTDSLRKIRAFLDFSFLFPSPPSSLKGKSTLTSATPTPPSTASHLRFSPPQSARFSKFLPRYNQVPVHLQQQHHHHPCPACNDHGCGGMMMSALASSSSSSSSSSSTYKHQIHHTHLLHRGNHWQ